MLSVIKYNTFEAESVIPVLVAIWTVLLREEVKIVGMQINLASVVQMKKGHYGKKVDKVIDEICLILNS